MQQYLLRLRSIPYIKAVFDLEANIRLIFPSAHLTSFPLCWAERVSLRAKTFPQTEISRQTPGAGSDTNSPAGCITSTPLVVRPSIKPSDVLHLAARSWETHTHTSTHRGQTDVKVKGMMGRHREMIVEVDVRSGWLEKQPTLLFSVAIFSSVQNDYCTD